MGACFGSTVYFFTSQEAFEELVIDPNLRGSLSGSLWTIPVEIRSYALAGLIACLSSRKFSKYLSVFCLLFLNLGAPGKCQTLRFSTHRRSTYGNTFLGFSVSSASMRKNEPWLILAVPSLFSFLWALTGDAFSLVFAFSAWAPALSCLIVTVLQKLSPPILILPMGFTSGTTQYCK